MLSVSPTPWGRGTDLNPLQFSALRGPDSRLAQQACEDGGHLSPGGAPDTLARVLADKWGQSLGQTFTVDNKPGAGGHIGSDFVAKSVAG